MIEREFPASDDSLHELIAFLESELEKVDCPMKLMMQISVAVEEIFVNIAHYAYGANGMGQMVFGLDPSPEGVTIRFTDSGVPFDPLAKKDPDITLSAEERSIGGLGIYMVKKSMDSVDYEYTDHKNILTLYKKF